jgi:hypothetical protein
MNLDGSAPTDNPFYDAANGINARDFVYTYGHRNPFGGAWRASNEVHYVVENGNGLDRMVPIAGGQSYGWNGSDSTLVANSTYVWNPATAPVNAVFVQQQTFNNSLFPSSVHDDLFVTLSGPTYAAGPQANGKRIEWFTDPDTLNGSGKLATAPTTLLRYNGTGRATLSALAAGPDGLYFSDLYRDDGAGGPTAGANVYRVRYVDFQPSNVTATPGTAQVTLNWLSNPLAASHNVYRRSGGGPLILIASGVGTPFYTDTTATPGTQYHYVVRGNNAGGESSDSNGASATPLAPAANQPPTIAVPASAAVDSNGHLAALSVLGADDGGEASLTYTWSLQGTPPAPVMFSENGTNGAKFASATFAASGTYEFAVTVRDAAGLTAQSSVTVTVNRTPGNVPPGNGNGLAAVYFNEPGLTGTSIVRTDATIDFDFAAAPPDPFIAAETFSARWIGEVEPVFSETYTFTTTSDDDVRLWVDDALVIDQWNDQAAATHSGTAALVNGQRHRIRLEYYQNAGPSVVSLAWQSASQPFQIVPKSQLYSGGPIKVNFQPAGRARAPVEVPVGYVADYGALFGDRGNGHSYGWNGRTAGGRDRNRTWSPDQRYDTFLPLRRQGLRRGVWELAVPNGPYRVHVVSGDAVGVRGALKVNVEGAPVIDGAPNRDQRWLDGWADVAVADGRLTLSAGAGARNNKINFIDVLPLETSVAPAVAASTNAVLQPAVAPSVPPAAAATAPAHKPDAMTKSCLISTVRLW